MAQRSRADKVEDGRKAAARKLAQYGPDELNRRSPSGLDQATPRQEQI